MALTNSPSKGVDVPSSRVAATPLRFAASSKNTSADGSADATVLSSMSAKPKQCSSKAQLKKRKRQMANLRRTAPENKAIAEDMVETHRLRKKCKDKKNIRRRLADSIPKLVSLFPLKIFCLPV